MHFLTGLPLMSILTKLHACLFAKVLDLNPQMNFSMNTKVEFVTLYDPLTLVFAVRFMCFVASLSNLVFICLDEAITVVCFAVEST